MSRILLWLVLGGFLAIAACQAFQPDGLAAITAIPPWCWLIALSAGGGFVFRRVLRGEKVALVIVAVLFAAFFVEQTASLLRGAVAFLVRSHPAESALRVVTLNCSGGSRRIAEEVIAFDPDIVFLQESPDESALRELATQLFGEDSDVIWTSDCSILARGSLRRHPSAEHHFVQATLGHPDGREVELICVRLSPPVVRYDLWSPSCWRDHAASRRKHRSEVEAIAAALQKVPGDRPIVLGGDFNAPAGDGALRELSPRLMDAFDRAGKGWGATVLNSVPVLRFDQLWTSDLLKPGSIRAERSERSDHRLVVGVFEFEAPRGYPASQKMPAAMHSP